ncbi:MAG: putative O-methyltransferase [Verrucomicrobiae bacterium]|nr:putative O-methyltransferase [Verrucomicrobiae bacterium]
MSLLTDIDRYIEQLCIPPNVAFEQAIRDAKANGLPEINVSPNEGKLLYLLAKITGARRILEIGTLGGYSTLWLASALPARGKLVTLELEPHHAAVARKNLDRAGLLKKVEIRVGNARLSLRQLKPAFDLVFIDADKEGYPVYLDFALKLTRPGSLILVDNVIRHGRVLDQKPKDAGTRAIRKVNHRLATNPRLETILVPLMRERIDGLAIARRR